MKFTIENHPSVRDALMITVGEHFRDRYASKTGLLIDLKDGISLADTEQQEKFLGEIWPIVDRINGKFGKEAEMKKACLLITDPKRPLPRSPKGTIRKSAAMDLYSKELESL